MPKKANKTWDKIKKLHIETDYIIWKTRHDRLDRMIFKLYSGFKKNST